MGHSPPADWLSVLAPRRWPADLLGATADATTRECAVTASMLWAGAAHATGDPIVDCPVPNTLIGDTVADRQTRLAVVQSAARACRRCVDAGHIDVARPVFAGDANCRVMLIGQAPGVRSRDGGRPFAGPSGKALADWFRRAGFTEGYFPDHVYCTSVTRCFPGPAKAGGDRPPSPAERALCRPWLDAELRLVRPDVVLLVGRIAVVDMLPALAGQPLAALVGTSIHERDVEWIPLPHPSGASRWLNAPENRALVDGALAILSDARERLMHPRVTARDGEADR